jgi:hypothetical protein
LVRLRAGGVRRERPDSGRVEEVSSSIPLPEAQAEFAAQALGAQNTNDGSAKLESLVEFERQLRQAQFEAPSAISNFTIVDTPPGDQDTQKAVTRNREQASRLIVPIVTDRRQNGPRRP